MKVKVTEYPLFYRIELEEEPWLVSVRTMKEAKQWVDETLEKKSES